MVKPLRVLHVSQPTEAGVAAVVQSYLSVSDPDLTHVVACPTEGDLSREVGLLGHQHVPWAASRSPGTQIFGETNSLRRIVRQVRPDIVHLHSSKAGLAGRLALRGTLPTVFQPHAWSFSAVGGLTGDLSLRWERAAQRWTHATVCVGHDERARGVSARILRPGHCTGNGYVLPNLIDPTRWPVTDRAEARRGLGLAVDTPLVVCVGRLCEQKGQDLLLQVWPRVRAALGEPTAANGPQEVGLVLVGDGPNRGSLSRSCPPGVRMVGSADPQPWYAAADVVVVPSRWEAMAVVPLEAQACARLVVATEVDGMRERLHPEQLIVPPGSPDALAEALIRALSDIQASTATGLLARQLTEQQWLPHERHDHLKEVYAAALQACMKPTRSARPPVDRR